MVLVANAGLRTPSGALQHFLAVYSPAYSPVHPRSSLSLRAESADDAHAHAAARAHSASTHALRRPCACAGLPRGPIPPPELFDF
ncbi:hypothetical protein ABMA28_010630 [Loxostege sticticalis]|uniref:Uncharacterized protein n=1 Tax=Loxostege sticticalis TaxID=481309 RepID=A0ABD0SB25_LOXSC